MYYLCFHKARYFVGKSRNVEVVMGGGHGNMNPKESFSGVFLSSVKHNKNKYQGRILLSPSTKVPANKRYKC